MIWAIGFTALILVQASLLPKVIQLFKDWRRGGGLLQTEPILMYWMLTIGLALYLWYSIAIYDPVYITSNIVGVTKSSFILYMIYEDKLQRRTQRKRPRLSPLPLSR